MIACRKIKPLVVGSFSSTDADLEDNHTYILVNGEGHSGNGSFSINDNNLITAAVFDYEIQSSYSIRVRTTDADGSSYEKVFTIIISDTDELFITTWQNNGSNQSITIPTTGDGYNYTVN